MKYRTILFDLDGTLLEETTASTIALQKWSKQLGLPADIDRWLAIEHKWFLAYEKRRNHPRRTALRPDS